MKDERICSVENFEQTFNVSTSFTVFKYRLLHSVTDLEQGIYCENVSLSK